MKKKTKSNLPSNYYVDPAELKKEILISLEQDELTANALSMLQLMVKKISTKFSYKYPEDREDCQSSAIFDVLRYWRGFDPEKSNYPFSYYTTMIRNGMAKGIRKIRPKSETELIRISGDEFFNIG